MHTARRIAARLMLLSALWIFVPASYAQQIQRPLDTRPPGSGTPNSPEGTGGREPFEEFSKHIKSRSALAVVGDDLFGDQVNLYTGALSFAHTDASIPGNSALPVAIARTLDISARPNYALNDRAFGDWDLDLPRIEGTYGRQANGVYWSLNRCQSQQPPASIQVSGDNLFQASDFWTGVQARMPSGGELLVIDAGSPTPAPTDAAPAGGYKWITPGYTYISCLPGAASDGGDGFLARAPDGSTYRFTHMAQFFVPQVAGPQHVVPGRSGNLNRRLVALYPSLVTDRFGHTVSYTYTNTPTEPLRLTAIQGSDGRALSLFYNGDGHIREVQEGARSWLYGYSTAAGRKSLASVQRPDGSRWTLNLKTLSDADVDYSVDPGVPPRCDDLPFANGIYLPQSATLLETVSGTITHPSGAVGSFEVTFGRNGRSNIPRICTQIMSGGAMFGDYANIPRVGVLLQIKQKQITGPGLAPLVWDYNFGTAFAFLPASTAPCFQGSCAGTNRASVIGPALAHDPNQRSFTRTEYGNSYQYNENKLLKIERGELQNGSPSAQASILETLSNSYALPSTSPPSTPAIGRTLRTRGDGFASEHPRPETQAKTTRDGVDFTRTSSNFDAYYRPELSVKASTMGFSRSEAYEYYDQTELWVLGQMHSMTVTQNGVPQIMQQMDYYAENAKMQRQFSFGKLQTRMEYHMAGSQAGLPSAVYDGGDTKYTLLDNYYRGLPRLVTYFDSQSESATVNDFGELTSLTNAANTTTGYQYDAMGRISQITHPTEAANWFTDEISYSQASTAAFGLQAGHWVRTMDTGDATSGFMRSRTYFDALWRPVLEDTHELVGGVPVAATRRMRNLSYDYASREIYSSNPARSIADIAARPNGVYQQYDGIGRLLRMRQDAEASAGTIEQSYSYLPDFKTQITDALGRSATMSYQAFEQPGTDAPIRIEAPAGTEATPTIITTLIDRDIYGKPITISRTDANNANITATRSYAYDAEQRLCKRTEPESGSTVYNYDASNNIDWMASGLSLPGANCDQDSVAAAVKVSMTYDDRNRLTATSYADGTTATTRTYTPDSMLETLTHDGSVWTYSYNARRMLRGESLSLNGQSYVLGYGFNRYGHSTSMTYPDKTVLNYSPNLLGEPTQVSGFASSVVYHPNLALAGFSYANGRTYESTLNERQLPNTMNISGVLSDQYVWDKVGNLSGISDLGSSAPQSRNRTMGYDRANRLTSASFAGAGSYTYAYDDLDNLITATRPGASIRYVYDQSRQRLTRLERMDTSAELIGYQFDDRGNTTQRRASPMGRSNQDFRFDRANRMLEVRAQNSPTIQAKYRFDGADRRVQSNDADGQRVELYNAAGTLVYEVATPCQSGQVGCSPQTDAIFANGFENANRAALGSSPKIYAHIGSQLIGTRENGVTTAVHTDHLGSVVAESTANTIAGLTHRPLHEAYGAPTTGVYTQGPDFTGHVTDSTTGLSYMQARFYDPLAGRFLSVDPVAANAGMGFSRYAYGANNPFKFVDPDGRQVENYDEMIAANPAIKEYVPAIAIGSAAILLTGPTVVAAVAEAGAGLAVAGSVAATGEVAGGAQLAAAALTPAAATVAAIATDGVVGGAATYEIVDGVRRAKAASMVGSTTIKADVMVGEKLSGTADVPISSLLSPNKSTIEMTTAGQTNRFTSVLDATKNGSSLPPITVTPGSKGIPIKDVTLDRQPK